MAAFTNATGFLLAVEQTLGWPLDPPPGGELWRARMVWAGKVNKAIKKDPELYTWDNLECSLEYCRTKRIAVKSPLYLFSLVEKALAEKERVETPKGRARPLGELIDQAIAHEMSTQAPGWTQWVGRLSRAAGPGRAEMHREWLEARRDQ